MRKIKNLMVLIFSSLILLEEWNFNLGILKANSLKIAFDYVKLVRTASSADIR